MYIYAPYADAIANFWENPLELFTNFFISLKTLMNWPIIWILLVVSTQTLRACPDTDWKNNKI